MAQVLTHIEPNPKRTNSGAWHRYNLYQLGRTEEDLLAMGLQKGDLAWDTKNNFVRFEEGERSTEPLPAAPVPTEAAEKPARTRGATSSGRGQPEAATVAEPESSPLSAVSSVPRGPAVSLAAPGPERGEKLASWYKIPVLVEARAPEGPQDRTWTVTVTAKDGSKRWKTAPGDQLALALVRQILLVGYDPDSWTEANDGKSGV